MALFELFIELLNWMFIAKDNQLKLWFCIKFLVWGQFGNFSQPILTAFYCKPLRKFLSRICNCFALLWEFPHQKRFYIEFLFGYDKFILVPVVMQYLKINVSLTIDSWMVYLHGSQWPIFHSSTTCLATQDRWTSDHPISSVFWQAHLVITKKFYCLTTSGM